MFFYGCKLGLDSRITKHCKILGYHHVLDVTSGMLSCHAYVEKNVKIWIILFCSRERNSLTCYISITCCVISLHGNNCRGLINPNVFFYTSQHNTITMEGHPSEGMIERWLSISSLELTFNQRPHQQWYIR